MRGRFGISTNNGIDSYMPMPNFFTHQFWNTNILLSGPLEIGREGCAVLSLGLLTVSIALLAPKPLALLLYLSGTLAMLTFMYVKYLGFLRHHGHLFILFVAALWMARQYPQYAWRLGWRTRILDFFAAHSETLITALFSVHLASGPIAAGIDLVHPFSASKKAAGFIEQQHLQDTFIVGSVDFVVAPLSAYLHRMIYYPQSGRFGSFIVWDNRRRWLTGDELLARVTRLMRERNTNLLLVLNSKLVVERNGGLIPLGSGELRDGSSISLLATFTESIVPEEQYYLYLIKRAAPTHDPNERPSTSRRAPQTQWGR